MDVAVLTSLLRERYPAHRLDDAKLTGFAAQLPADAAPFIDDVVLALACVGHDPQALREFEQTIVASAAQHLRDRRFALDIVEDSVQASRIALLVGETARPPSLLQYRGRGPLRAFVRTVCTRRAMTLSSAGKRGSLAALQAFADAPQTDIELEYMRTQYGTKLSGAMKTAWTRLQKHDRFILGLALEKGVSTDEIARICGIHRASATRRLASARAALLALARETLQTELAIGGATLDSILRLFTTSVQWEEPGAVS